MMLKSKSSQSQRSAWTLLRAGLAGLAVTVGGAALTAGCLDRPVAPAVPKTSNIYVDEIRQTAVDKIDLLFMIDNSISMADKQAILADAVPLLVQRLVTPICVKACTKADNCTPAQEKDGIPAGGNADATGRCAQGSPEFNPIKDIHVGVITSSLGSHGAAGPKDVCVAMEDDDHAHLLGSIRPGVESYNNTGFLKWDATKTNPPKYNPPGDSNPGDFGDKFTAMVKSSGEHGCGYEASLEAWYRFLIDPEPPAAIVVPDGTSKAIVKQDANGLPELDGTVLAQRKAFLRPDSLVAVVMLSDENDCSIQDKDYGWLVSRAAPMYRATSQCANNPNDKCCQSCAETNTNSGCPDIKADVECAKGQSYPANSDSDQLNLRCWQQKRRFGFDLLYPIERYSSGLRDSLIYNRAGQQVGNPLFAASDGKTARDKGLVFLAGIIGVPWQDIADADSLKGPGLRYMTEAELEAADRWTTILGNPNPGDYQAPVPPTDPLMIEQPDERSGANPITKDPIAPSSATTLANPINGHEQINQNNSDLQYACIFKLQQPLLCDKAAFDADKGCDCYDTDQGFNRPLCGGAGGLTQSYAKAYPGTRHLQVLKQFKDNSIVASICPKIPDDKANADYGYNPAVKAIIDRLKEALKGKCLPRPLAPNQSDQVADGLEKGQVPCKVIEAVLPQNGGACSCATNPNRVDTTDVLRSAVLNKLQQGESCGTKTGQTKCEDFCTCELLQLKGNELGMCQNDASPPNVAGYCYVNAAPNEPNVGNADLVKDCSADSKRLLRFVGDTPAPGAIALVACLGAAL